MKRLPIIILALCGLSWGSVAFDAKISGGNGGSGDTEQASAVTTISSTHLTIGASATCLVVLAGIGGATVDSTAMTAHWDSTGTNQAMTLAANIQGAGTAHTSAWTFFLTNPTTGNHTLKLDWTGSNDIYVGAVSFTGTSTSACVNTADNFTATTGTTATVTSTTDGATAAMFITNGGSPTMNFNQIWKDSALNPGGGGSYQLGGTSNAHTFTGAGGTDPALAGVHIVAASAASGHCNGCELSRLNESPPLNAGME